MPILELKKKKINRAENQDKQNEDIEKGKCNIILNLVLFLYMLATGKKNNISRYVFTIRQKYINYWFPFF